jgi:hypothetical protein
VPERRNTREDIELTAIRGILSSLQIVPFEYRERVMHYVHERMPALPYINESGEEIAPQPEVVPRVPLADRDRSARVLDPVDDAAREDKSGG